VITAAGVQNVLTKSLGSTTAHNVVKATLSALVSLKDPRAVARLRGKTVEEVLGIEVKPEPGASVAPAVAAAAEAEAAVDEPTAEAGA
jgi:hypothetical protein